MFEGRMPRYVTAAEITRNFGMWQDRAAQGPIIVTHHGRPRVVMLASDYYETLSQGHDAHGENEDLEAARLSVVLGQIGTAFAAFDADLRFVRVNAGAVAHFGLPEEKLLGQTPDAVLHGRETLLVGHLREALRTGEEMQVDLPAGPQGERLLRMRLFPYPGGVAATFRNVAGLRNAEKAESEQIAHVHARGAHGGIGVGRIGPRGTFEKVEPALAELAGFPAERLIGIRVSDILGVSGRAMANAAIEAVLTGRGPQAFDAPLLVNGGGERSARFALADVRDGFAVVGAVLVVTPHVCP